VFVAIRSTEAGRVTSIDPDWDDQTSVLRDLARRGQLLCPGCRQLLWLRTGEVRRRHFAHRSLTDCPLAHQSAETLEVKAQLYLFLQKKFPGAVALDKAIGDIDRDRIVDLLVESGSGLRFAYWVFDREQRDREVFFAYRSAPGVHTHFIHTASTLRPDCANRIKLSASQRYFISSSRFDVAIAGEGAGHLNFYQVETAKLFIYRGLSCVHRPNLYGWNRLRQGDLDSALISPKKGEIVFAEDEAARASWKQSRTPAQNAYAAPPKSSGTKRSEHLAQERPVELARPLAGTELAPEAPSLMGPFRCEECGMETTEWSSATPSAGTCVCKTCTRKRWEAKRAAHH